MTDYTWTNGNSTGYYDDSLNWSPNGIPSSGDTATFDATSTANCIGTTSQSFPKCGAMTFTSAYTGTFTCGGAATRFEHYADLSLGANATYTIANGKYAMFRDGAGISLLSGTITSAGTGYIHLRVRNNSIAAGAYSAPVKIYNDSATYTLTFLSGTFTFNKSFEIFLTNNNATTLTCSANSPNFDFKADINFGAGTYPAQLTYTKGSGSITLSGSIAQSINFNAESIEDLEVDKTAGTVTLTGGFTTDTLTLTQGTLDVNAQSITSVGAFSMSAGTSLVD